MTLPQIGPYSLDREIGRGSFANVYYGEHKIEHHPVAIKSVQISKLTRKLLDNLEVEISILKGIQHPHIVKLLDCYVAFVVR